RGHIIAVGGDQPGLAALMGFAGSNCKRGCRYCNIEGIFNKHIYFPLPPLPTGVTLSEFQSDPTYLSDLGLKLRSEDDILEDCEKLVGARNKSHRKEILKATGNVYLITQLTNYQGVSEVSVLWRLPTICWPWSFGIDLMHLATNVISQMFNHWTGRYFKDDDSRYVLRKDIWEEIGKDMVRGKYQIPTSFGRSPRDISRHHEGFKAEEWKNWACFLSVPLLRGRLSDRYLKPWADFVEVLRILHFSPEINEAQLEKVDKGCKEFYFHYER
ncbi:hypothetical protein BC829DRAFT_355092, partial [Chytridium lagenaria]